MKKFIGAKRREKAEREALSHAREKKLQARSAPTQAMKKIYVQSVKHVEREALPHVREKKLQAREGSKTGVQ